MEINEDIFKALEISQNVYDMLRENLKPGVSEKEIYQMVDKMILPYKKKNHSMFMGDFISGPRTAEIGGDPTDRKLEEHDVFMLDLSLRYNTGWCDTCRTFFIGEPTDEMKKAYQIILDAMQLGQETVKAGVIASSVKAAAEKFLEEKGMKGRMPHHMGHAVGKECYLKPAFEEGCDMEIADGEIVTLEPGLYFPGNFGIRVENDYVVQGDKLVNMFIYPTEMEYFIIK